MQRHLCSKILKAMTDQYTLLYPASVDWANFQNAKPLQPFADEVIEYLNALSAALLKERTSRLYPDVVTFAFFCRKANLLKQKELYVKDDVVRLGRGTLFHIAPSNVPINFAYSLVAGMLAGNYNIVRVSSKDFPQVDLVIKVMHTLLADYPKVAKSIALVRYDRTSDATAFFSSFAACRVIWGGDATIANIRKNEIPPRSFDICFADRYSIAAINPEAILAKTDAEMKKLAENFYNDTYLFDQNACSAPHLIFWLNKGDVQEAKEKFWTAVHEYVSVKYNLQAVLSVDKLTAFYRQAACMDSKIEPMPDNYIMRADLASVPKNIDAFRCAGGYFSEKTIDTLDEIAPIISNKYQTLAYYGIDKSELQEFVLRSRLTGLDRIVPFGETTAFALTWDGYNLIDTMSRVCSVL